MQVIAEGREIIGKLWGSPAPKETEYRAIRYLVRADREDGVLLLNTVTGELVFLDPTEAGRLNALPAVHSPWMDELIARHYLVPASFDERKSVDQLRELLRRLRTDKAITGYSILPTTACNARCFYCFESNEPRHTMTAELADKTVDYIAAHLGEHKKVQLKWFGGEPTVGEARIDQICDGLARLGIAYTSTMISNAYLFSKEMAKKARGKWKLVFIQITLDGTEEIYNRTKAYVNAQGSPFLRVMDNIGFLLEEKINVSVRMNLDHHNREDLVLLISDLAARFSASKYFSAYVAPLFENEGFCPVSHSAEERDDLIRTAVQLNGLIEEKGCVKASQFSAKSALPFLRERYCMADNPNSLQINPLGGFSKCEHVLYDRLVGDLEQGHDFGSENGIYWVKHGYDSNCGSCEFYPVCGLADICPARSACKPEQIDEKISDIRKLVSLKYDGYMLKKKEEIR